MKPRPFLFILIIAVSIFVFFPEKGEYTFDDIPAYTDNSVILKGNIFDVFKTNYWGNRKGYEHISIYRPISALSLFVEHKLFGFNKTVSVTINLLIHIANSLLLFFLARRITNESIAFLSFTIFLIHPIHTSVVMSAVNRAESLAFFFGLISILLWTNSKTILSLLFFVLSLLSKENGITVIGIFLLVDLFTKGFTKKTLKESLKRLTLFAAILPVYFIMRFLVLEKILGGSIPFIDNPMVGSSFLGKVQGVFTVFGKAILNFFAPKNLSPDYSFNELAVGGTFLSPLFLTGVIFFVLFAYLILFLLQKREAVIVVFGFMFFFITYSIISHVFFLSTIVFADRNMYMPSAGLAIASSGIFFKAITRERLIKTVLTTFLVIYLLYFGFASWVYKGKWKNNLTLFKHASITAPDSARVNANLGFELLKKNEYAKSLYFLKRSLIIYPEDYITYNNQGKACLKLNKFYCAKVSFFKSLLLNLNYAKAWNNLCYLYLKENKPEIALFYCKKAYKLLPDNPKVLRNTGNCYLRMGQNKRALSFFIKELNSYETPNYELLKKVHIFSLYLGMEEFFFSKIRPEYRKKILSK